MKNIITITSLLAAGTLAASAAVPTKLLWGFDFTSESLAASTGNVINLSGQGTIDTAGGAVAGTGSYLTGGTADGILKFTALGTTDDLKKQSGNFSISFHAKNNGTTGDYPVIASFGENNSWCFKLADYGFQFDTDGYGGTKNTSITHIGNNWQHYLITFEGAGSSSGAGKLTLYVDGVNIVTRTFSGTGADNDKAMTMFSFGGRLAHNGNNSNIYLSDLAVYKGVLAEDQIKYLIKNKANESAIPEPSAFGLLAGLGALALVGARRRRR